MIMVLVKSMITILNMITIMIMIVLTIRNNHNNNDNDLIIIMYCQMILEMRHIFCLHKYQKNEEPSSSFSSSLGASH